MVRVKICGITNIDDAMAAVTSGADALGFVFFKKSPRAVPIETAKEIVRMLPPFITTVGVFVNENPEEVENIVETTGIEFVQLHGDEPPEACRRWRKVIKAVRLKDNLDINDLKQYDVSAYLLDTYTATHYGGSGVTFDWNLALEAAAAGNIILSGGLSPDNIEKAVVKVRPFAVDVSSGVEKYRGKKDHEKIKIFIERAKEICLRTPS